MGQPGVTGHDVDATPCLDDDFGELLVRLFAGDIETERQRPFEFVGNRLGCIKVDVGDHDLGALGGKATSNRCAEATACAGHDHALVVEVHWVVPSGAETRVSRMGLR